MKEFTLQWANGAIQVPVAFSRIERVRCILSDDDFFIFYTDGQDHLLHTLFHKQETHLHMVKNSYIENVLSIGPRKFIRTGLAPDFVLEGAKNLRFVKGDELRIVEGQD